MNYPTVCTIQYSSFLDAVTSSQLFFLLQAYIEIYVLYCTTVQLHARITCIKCNRHKRRKAERGLGPHFPDILMKAVNVTGVSGSSTFTS